MNVEHSPKILAREVKATTTSTTMIYIRLVVQQGQTESTGELQDILLISMFTYFGRSVDLLVRAL